MSDPAAAAVSEPAAPDTDRIERMARIVLRPVGSPLPLGFSALAVASVVLSGLKLGWVPSDQAHQVAVVLVAFTAPLQALAAVFGFLSRDSVGGTGMSLLAGTWAVTGVILLGLRPAATSPTLGLVLLAVASALAVPVAAASLGKLLAAAVMAGAGVRFALTAVFELAGVHAWETGSGWWGLGLAALALYAALAFEVEDTRRSTVLPVLRHGVGHQALHGGIVEQLDRVQREAGVREQL